jgi:hypothetical protein
MILAMITVYQCEDCPRVAICRHQVEYDTYETTWFDGLRYQFCPNCRFKPQAEDRIAEDQQRTRTIAELTNRGIKIEYVN